jgi:hypothetical protein
VGLNVLIMLTVRCFIRPKRQSVSLFVSDSINESFIQSFGYLVNKSRDW